jgi:hypothetical protein
MTIERAGVTKTPEGRPAGRTGCLLGLLLASIPMWSGCSSPAIAAEPAAAQAGKDAAVPSASQAIWQPPPPQRPKRRPDCRRPARFLRPQNLSASTAIVDRGQQWAAVRYGPDLMPDGGIPDKFGPLDWGPESEQALAVESDYFSGLKPGKWVRVAPAGLAKVSAVRARYRLMEENRKFTRDPATRKVPIDLHGSEFKPAFMGVFSDHCIEVAPNDRTLIFSVLLSETLALQAVGERLDEAVYDRRDDGPSGTAADDPIPDKAYANLDEEDCSWRPFKTIRLRVVKLGTNQVVSESPKVTLGAKLAKDFELTDMHIHVLGDTESAPVMVGFSYGRAIAVVTRDGKIPVFRNNLCASWNLEKGISFWISPSAELRSAPYFGARGESNNKTYQSSGIAGECAEDYPSLHAALAKLMPNKNHPPSPPAPK